MDIEWPYSEYPMDMVERLKQENAHLHHQTNKLSQTVLLLRTALDRYGGHDAECSGQPVYDIPCDCGFEAALAAGHALMTVPATPEEWIQYPLLHGFTLEALGKALIAEARKIKS